MHIIFIFKFILFLEFSLDDFCSTQILNLIKKEEKTIKPEVETQEKSIDLEFSQNSHICFQYSDDEDQDNENELKDTGHLEQTNNETNENSNCDEDNDETDICSEISEENSEDGSEGNSEDKQGKFAF